MADSKVVHLCWSVPGDEDPSYVIECRAQLDGREPEIVELLRYRPDGASYSNEWEAFGSGGHLDQWDDTITTRLTERAAEDMTRHLEPGWNVRWDMRDASDVQGEFDGAFRRWAEANAPEPTLHEALEARGLNAIRTDECFESQRVIVNAAGDELFRGYAHEVWRWLTTQTVKGEGMPAIKTEGEE